MKIKNLVDEDRRKYQRQYYLANRERLLAKQKKYAQENKDMLSAYWKEYRQKNKEKISARDKEYKKEYKEKNKKKIAERAKEYRARTVQKRKEYNSEWYANIDKEMREVRRKRTKQDYWKHREKRIEVSKQYAKKNRDKCAALQNERRCRKIRATPIWFKKEIKKVQLVYKKARDLGFEVDHIVPINSKKVSGLHTWANLQLLDTSLNSSKGNRYWPDMPGEKRK